MKKLVFYRKLTAVLILAGLAIAGTFAYTNFIPTPHKDFDLKNNTFDYLTAIREEKKQAVKHYFSEIKAKVNSAASDEKLTAYFKSMQSTKPSAEVEYALDVYYVTNYENFYDILFVDPKGTIFHSIKKEADYHKNIYQDFAQSTLAKTLQDRHSPGFAEFEYYSPSDEPAAFFPVAMTENGIPLGWLIFQCASNKVNTILTAREGLGRTGEVYLVNQASFMLSDSRFMSDSTILQHKVDTLAVKKALKSGQGEEIIDDYRGVKVFSAFEKFDVFGTTWIIIVEIDEAEVITEHYQKYQRYFTNKIIEYVTAVTYKSSLPLVQSHPAQRIDINEYAKAVNDEALATLGVATCTAVAITYPGKMAYLAHISPSDDLYNNSLFGGLQAFYPKNKGNNFLAEIIEKIQRYEIYPYQINKLEFAIVAPHAESVSRCIDTILKHGGELASIKFIFNPAARSANVFLPSSGENVFIKWNAPQVAYQSALDVEDLASIIKKIINYNS